ncbi:MAG: NRDE family protein [Pseudomonadota bacterium]|nr:NRDE family protein [Pseudomonadota bacterium]
MCLIAFTIGQNPAYPLVIAANRDEFFRRPTAAMDWWTPAGQSPVLAGRDLASGGTWLAVAADGRVAAVTNVREGSQESGQRSRGELPLLALSSDKSALSRDLKDHPDRYAGFNLVSLGTDGGWYYSNRDAHPGRRVFRGSYGLSNHLLQTPWPKLLTLRGAVTERVALADQDTDRLHEDLIHLLQDTRQAPDHLLPDTGVGQATERFLSSPFIIGDDYGTRATTIVTVAASGQIQVTEQSWNPGARAGERRRFQWQR